MSVSPDSAGGDKVPIAAESASNLDRRIDKMFMGDKIWACGFVVVLWLSYAFVFFAINAINTDNGIKIVMLVAGALVLLYNTASITSMIRHYAEDKKAIYAIDILHLDEMRHDRASRHHIE